MATTYTHPLLHRLHAAGYTPGPPLHITPASRAIDAGLCRRSSCPHCKGRGRQYRPYHRGREYRVAAHCPRCEHSEEV